MDYSNPDDLQAAIEQITQILGNQLGGSQKAAFYGYKELEKLVEDADPVRDAVEVYLASRGTDADRAVLEQAIKDARTGRG